MLTEPAVTHPHTDQERVAIQAVEYNLKALPVVDQNHRLLGVVPSDAILSVLHAEGIEDMLRTVGIQSSGKEIMSASVVSAFKQRIPWLIVGLFGGLAAASLISGFEGALREQLLLAAFIPAVVYIADAVGGQSQTVFVRLLLLQPNIALGGYLWRELRLGSMLAVSLAGLLAALSWFFHGEWVLSSILFLSIGITVMLAATIGVILPWLFSRFKLDPAVASGPFATVLRDLTSLAIYFSIALLLLERV
jgi:magnesium transporter